jgi:hypothetical protein
MGNVGAFYVHLKYIMAIWNILGSFSNLVVSWYIFPRLGILYQEKSGIPGMHILQALFAN